MIYASKAELKAEVTGSYLNWLWWILEPILFMLIYVFIVSVIFKTSEKYFPVFVLIGLMVWSYFNRTIKNSIKTIKSNRNIITRIYVPKFVFTMINMIVNTFKMAISFMIIVAMMIVYKVPVSYTVIYIIPIVAVLNVFIFGICMLLMHYGVFVGDLSNIVNVTLRFMFYLTGVFYSIKKRIPSPYGTWILRLNPIAYLTDQMRNVLIYGKAPSFKMLAAWLAAGILLSIIGIRTVYKNENSYAKVI